MHSPVVVKRVHELKTRRMELNLCAMKWKKFIAKEWKAAN